MYIPKTAEDFREMAEALADAMETKTLMSSVSVNVSWLSSILADVANNSYDEAIIDLGKLKHEDLLK